MRKRLATLLALTLGLLLVGVGSGVLTSRDADAARGNNGTVRLTTTLTGDEEVPGPGDPDGRGVARITLLLDEGLICYDLLVIKIDPATAAHIHEAPSGDAGRVVQGLMAPTDGTAEGCVAADPALIADIAANPSDYYVNVHNAEYPGGAVRGQLG